MFDDSTATAADQAHVQTTMPIPSELAQICLPLKFAHAIIELVDASQQVDDVLAAGISTYGIVEKVRMLAQQFLVSISYSGMQHLGSTCARPHIVISRAFYSALTAFRRPLDKVFLF